MTVRPSPELCHGADHAPDDEGAHEDHGEPREEVRTSQPGRGRGAGLGEPGRYGAHRQLGRVLPLRQDRGQLLMC